MEVILICSGIVGETVGILHVCGGDPTDPVQAMVDVLYSPRMWR